MLDFYAKEVLREIADMGGSLCEEEPHLYSVADIEECPHRRWITITDVIKNKYLEDYYHSVVDSSSNKNQAIEDVCSHMIHLVLGGVVTSYMLSGRVWEVCPGNILLRTHVLGGFDWTMVQAQESLIPIMEEISRLSGLSESICWGPLHGLINGYAKLAMHRYPRKQEQVERRMHCIYESCERLGLPLKRRVSRL